MEPWHPDHQSPYLLMVMDDIKRGGEPFEDDFLGLKIGLCGQPICRKPLLQPRDETLDIWMVQTENRQAIERNLFQEAEEGVLDLLNAVVVIEVLRINIGHHGNRGHQPEKGTIALIGLSHQVFSLA